MKKILLFFIELVALFACSKETGADMSGEPSRVCEGDPLEVMASIASTKTYMEFGSDQGSEYIRSFWRSGDIIYLTPMNDTETHYIYACYEDGTSATFVPVLEKDVLRGISDGTEFYACTPSYAYSSNYVGGIQQSDSFLDFLVAKAVVRDGRLDLQFSHAYSFLLISLPESLTAGENLSLDLGYRNHTPITISAFSEYIYDFQEMKFFDESVLLSNGAFYSLRSFLSSTTLFADNSILLRVLPTEFKEGEYLAFQTYDKTESVYCQYASKALPSTGLQPGVVYRVNISEDTVYGNRPLPLEQLTSETVNSNLEGLVAALCDDGFIYLDPYGNARYCQKPYDFTDVKISDRLNLKISSTSTLGDNIIVGREDIKKIGYLPCGNAAVSPAHGDADVLKSLAEHTDNTSLYAFDELLASVNGPEITLSMQGSDAKIVLHHPTEEQKLLFEDGNLYDVKVWSIYSDGENVYCVLSDAEQAGVPFLLDMEATSVTFEQIQVSTSVSKQNVYYMFQCEKLSYVTNFSSDEELMTAELAYWENKYGNSYADYGYSSYKDLLLRGVCSKGDVVKTFSNRSPSTNYVVYAFAIDAETLEPASDLFTLEVVTPAKPIGQWNYVGTGLYNDGFIHAMFGMPEKEIEVEIYQSPENPNKYAMRNPYGPDMLYDWWYDDSVTLDMIIDAENNVWRETYFEFTISGSDVQIPLQEIGVHMSLSSLSFSGWPEAGAPAAYGMYGVYEDGLVTVPEKGAVIAFGSNVYYANTDGVFRITMPEAYASMVSAGRPSVKHGSHNLQSVRPVTPLKRYLNNCFPIMQ